MNKMLQQTTSAAMIAPAMMVEMSARMGSAWAYRMSETMRGASTLAHGTMDATRAMLRSQAGLADDAAEMGAEAVEDGTDAMREVGDAVAGTARTFAQEAADAGTGMAGTAAHRGAATVKRASGLARDAVDPIEDAVEVTADAAKDAGDTAGDAAKHGFAALDKVAEETKEAAAPPTAA